MHRFLSSIIFSALFAGCGIYETKVSPSAANRLEGSAELGALLSDPLTPISFSDVNRFIFKSECYRCHNDSNAKDGVSVENFTRVREELARIDSSVMNGEMPKKGPLSSDLQLLLRRWIDQGAPEFAAMVLASPSPTATPMPTPTPMPMPSATPAATATPTLVATYTSLREAVFVPKCIKCHQPGGNAEEFPMHAYAPMMVTENDLGEKMIVPNDPDASTTVTEIEAGRMPKKSSGIAPVTPEELNVIRQWILEGAKE